MENCIHISKWEIRRSEPLGTNRTQRKYYYILCCLAIWNGVNMGVKIGTFGLLRLFHLATMDENRFYEKIMEHKARKRNLDSLKHSKSHLISLLYDTQLCLHTLNTCICG